MEAHSLISTSEVFTAVYVFTLNLEPDQIIISNQRHSVEVDPGEAR